MLRERAVGVCCGSVLRERAVGVCCGSAAVGVRRGPCLLCMPRHEVEGGGPTSITPLHARRSKSCAVKAERAEQSPACARERASAGAGALRVRVGAETDRIGAQRRAGDGGSTGGWVYRGHSFFRGLGRGTRVRGDGAAATGGVRVTGGGARRSSCRDGA